MKKKILRYLHWLRRSPPNNLLSIVYKFVNKVKRTEWSSLFNMAYVYFGYVVGEMEGRHVFFIFTFLNYTPSSEPDIKCNA